MSDNSKRRRSAKAGNTKRGAGDELTPRQRTIVEYIQRTHRTRGYPPSVREIGDAVGLASPSSVHAQLARLAERGYLRKDPDRPRAIVVTEDLKRSSTPARRQPRTDVAEVPLVGSIAAGSPILAQENVEETLPIPTVLCGSGTLFALKVRGDSMIDAGILDGDTVIIRQQATAEDGEIVAALLDGEEATVKTLRRRKGRVLLEPANDAYEPIEADDVSILGKVVTVLRRV